MIVGAITAFRKQTPSASPVTEWRLPEAVFDCRKVRISSDEAARQARGKFGILHYDYH